MLTAAEQTYLKSPQQRFRLYVALFPPYQITQSTVLIEKNNVETVELADWKPVLNLGPHRLAFVGEEIAFTAERSYHRGENPTKPDLAPSVAGGEWFFDSGSLASAAGVGEHLVSWSAPGLYQVTYENGGQLAVRWVRVYQDRLSLPFAVVDAGSVSGGLDGGWRGQITIMPTGAELAGGAIADYQGVGVFCEEEWLVDGAWVRQPISGYEPSQRLLCFGYVSHGTLKFDANTHSASFELISLAELMNTTMIYATSLFQTTTPQNGGTVFKDLATMAMPDAIIWLLQFHTDVLRYHDFVTYYDGSQQNIDAISSKEGMIWSVLSEWVQNEFSYLYCDPGSGLHMEPNPNLRSKTTWQAMHPVRMRLDQSYIWQASVDQNKSKNVIFVQVIGTRAKDGKQFIAAYPSTPPSGAGGWLKKSGYAFSQQAYVDTLPHRFYDDANREWRVDCSFGIFRALMPLDQVQLTLQTDEQLFANMVFVAGQVGFQIDVQGQTWTTTVHLEQLT